MEITQYRTNINNFDKKDINNIFNNFSVIPDPIISIIYEYTTSWINIELLKLMYDIKLYHEENNPGQIDYIVDHTGSLSKLQIPGDDLIRARKILSTFFISPDIKVINLQFSYDVYSQYGIFIQSHYFSDQYDIIESNESNNKIYDILSKIRASHKNLCDLGTNICLISPSGNTWEVIPGINNSYDKLIFNLQYKAYDGIPDSFKYC